jgi:hypothetical protein
MVGVGQESRLDGVADGHLGIVSAPLWDSSSSTFAGLLTTSDYINVVQYYIQYPNQLSQIDKFLLSNLRGMEGIQLEGNHGTD